jgi:dGTPase
MLARLRFDVGSTAGRRYPELPHPYRDDFQRDRDRVVHSRAFRRLENKTQVFPSGISDHFRNRLTHTIEVAQIARTVAATLELNQDLTEALALVHDIGHPPFAHAGEDELDRQMRRFGDRFNHNLHALRIVEHFEHRYARFSGLNLTFEVREGIVKHSHDIDTTAAGPLAEYLPDQRPPLEAQLIDLCDEIAYNTSDLDDAFSAGLLTANSVRSDVPRFEELYDTAEMQYPGAPERVRLHEVVRGLVDFLTSGMIRGTAEASAGVQSIE